MDELGDPLVLGFFDYLRILNHRKWVIVLVVLASVAGFVGSDLAKHKTYEASGEVVFPNTPTSSDTGQLDTQIRIFASPAVAAIVRKSYPHAEDASVQQQADSSVVTVTVQGPDSSTVADEANAYIRAFTTFQQQQESRANAQSALDTQTRIDTLQSQISDLRAQEKRQLTAIVAKSGPRSSAAQALTARINTQIRVLSGEQGVLATQLQNTVSPSSQNPVQVLSRASAPGSLVGPKPIQDGLLGLGAGLVLGILLAFVLEFLDESIRRRASLERALPRLPVLGTIPRIRGRRSEGIAPLPVLSAPRSLAAECFRATGTAIHLPTEEGFRRLLVTSAMPGEGKTMVAANLAVVTARAGQHTVLLDGNLRSPSVHRCFGLPNERGLSSVLFGQASLDEVLLPVPGVAGLTVLVAGPPPPNPWELLSAARFSRLLDELSERGIVILDSPAALQNSDASALAIRADATLLVANARISRRRELRQAVTMLERVETHMLGTVLIQVSTEEFEFGGGGTDPSPHGRPEGNHPSTIATEQAGPVPTRSR